ncbi:hypothetical protein OC842_007324 [Tilletia horrida]|uniref:Uncharacterized protein n=1 Tax=Tilletia horrida TaxID=155126 RepID=A0AAN6JH86_9BASI|nr:hypothetical protein OC842_007324 [Tilletia horrida]
MPNEDPTPVAATRNASDASSELPDTFAMSSSIIDTMINQAADRAVERAQSAFEKAVRGKLDEHKSHIDERLDAIDARLKALEVKAPSDSRLADAPPPAASGNTPRPHTAPLLSSAPTRPTPPPDSAAQSWEALSDEEKRQWRLHKAGLDNRPPPPHMPAHADGDTKDGNIPSRDSKSVRPATRDSTTSATSFKTFDCKPDRLPKFDGTPSKLEEWIDRVRDVTRSNLDPAWNRAVMATIPSVFMGAAARWHASLKDEVVEKRQTVADVFKELRHAFPVNRSQVRQAALQRRWTPQTETAVDYAYDKLGLLRTAYNLAAGSSKEEIELAEIVDGLPDSMRPMVRLPPGTSDMNVLVRELVEWEGVWRSVYSVFIADEKAQVNTEAGSVARPSGRPKSQTASSASSAPSALVPQPNSADANRRPRYDPSRVREAAGDQPRSYVRENGSLMRLNRPCGRCGEQHFDFEHAYIKEGARAFPLVYAGDYEIDDDAHDEDF